MLRATQLRFSIRILYAAILIWGLTPTFAADEASKTPERWVGAWASAQVLAEGDKVLPINVSRICLSIRSNRQLLKSQVTSHPGRPLSEQAYNHPTKQSTTNIPAATSPLIRLLLLPLSFMLILRRNPRWFR